MNIILALIGFCFFILELTTPGLFFLAAIGIGCTTGFFASMIFLSLNAQLIAIVSGTIISFIAFSYYAKQSGLSSRANTQHNFNINGLIGKKGFVTQKIDPITGGAVKIFHEEWKARTINMLEAIEKNQPVIVIKTEGNTLFIKPIEE